MFPQILQGVTLWLDHLVKEDGLFPHALEWASRLDVPLRVVAVFHPRVMEKLKVWGETSGIRGVMMETHLTLESNQDAWEHFVRPNALCVLPAFEIQRGNSSISHQLPYIAKVCRCYCENSFVPIGRVLIVSQDSDLGSPFLETAANLCQGLEITPNLLILAKSESAAELKQTYADEFFRARRLNVDIDFVVDRDQEKAVSRVVSWRRCSQVILPRSYTDSARRLPELSTLASVVVLPDELPFLFPRLSSSQREYNPLGAKNSPASMGSLNPSN